ncbi:MAG TPA: response regulator transcription factor [Opitutaceae bacterium]|jgi:DNA-binding NarL/FixJ family response regulator|nr:response regulator transcription factor [Opitutaceae bacterium]
MKKQRVVLIDDETVFRQLMIMALGRLPKVEIIGDFLDGQEGLYACLREKPDLLVVDLFLPSMHGFDIAREVKLQLPETRIVVLTSHANETLPSQLVGLGVHGFVSKTEPLKVVIEAVEKVMSGGLFFASSTPGKPPLSPLPAPAVTPLKNPLTPRELEVAVGVASGMSSKEIASKLDLSVRTVEKHRANIMDKVEVREVASLVRWCVQQGLIKV